MTEDFDDDDDGSLRWIRSPVEWELYEPVDGGRRLRVMYVQAGAGSTPGAAIAEVLLVESYDRVVVTLLERELAGTWPNGAGVGRTLAAVWGCLELELDLPLADRSIIDGFTGRRCRALDRQEAQVEGTDEWFAVHAADYGCPLWVR